MRKTDEDQYQQIKERLDSLPDRASRIRLLKETLINYVAEAEEDDVLGAVS
jgi:hypothetical protein